MRKSRGLPIPRAFRGKHCRAVGTSVAQGVSGEYTFAVLYATVQSVREGSHNENTRRAARISTRREPAISGSPRRVAGSAHALG